MDQSKAFVKKHAMGDNSEEFFEVCENYFNNSCTYKDNRLYVNDVEMDDYSIWEFVIWIKENNYL